MTISVRALPRVLCKRTTKGVSRHKETVNVGKVPRVVNERSTEVDMPWERIGEGSKEHDIMWEIEARSESAAGKYEVMWE
jgi:hypothetical protein